MNDSTINFSDAPKLLKFLCIQVGIGSTYNFLVFKYLNSDPLIFAFHGIYSSFLFLLQTG